MRRIFWTALAFLAAGAIVYSTPAEPPADPWSALAKHQLTNRRADKNDVSELFARLLLGLSGRELDPEAWRRTKQMADSPKDGFGLIHNDGLKWMLAQFVVVGRELDGRLKQSEARAAAQQAKIAGLAAGLDRAQSRADKLEAQVAQLKKQNDQLAKTLLEMQHTAAEFAKALASAQANSKPASR